MFQILREFALGTLNEEKSGFKSMVPVLRKGIEGGCSRVSSFAKIFPVIPTQALPKYWQTALC
jgi:hypothetical protein